MPNPNEQFQAMIAGLESAGYSRTEIARQAGVSRMTVWRLATGETRSTPLYQTFAALERLSKKVSGKPVLQKRG